MVSIIIKKLAIFSIIGTILQWVINVINNKITFLITRDLRNDAVNKLLKLPLKYIDMNQHGDIVSRVISDVDQIADGLLIGFTQIFTGVLTIILTIIFMIRMNYKMALVIIVLTPFSIFISKKISKRTYKLFKKQSEIRGKQTSFVNEMIMNQKTVISFNEQSKNIVEFDKINKELEEISLKSTFFSSITNPVTRFVNNIIYAVVTLIGAIFTLLKNISIGELSAFLSYSNQYTKPFNEISGILTELQNALVCSERVFEIIDENIEIELNKSSIEDIKGAIKFNNVDFGYSRENMVLHNINLNVNSGEKIAIVGPTGCGKTTLINLLMRFYDVNSGEILLDNKNINDIYRKNVRKSFGMVLQDTWIKNGTIKENIKIGKPEATDSEVIEASKITTAYDFISKLQNGFDTIVNDSNNILSEGERQLISITRIMLLNPPMLILDEATSNIDTRTEQRIQNAFDKLMEGRTSFIVAHRLSTIVSADCILVMKEGKIVEYGKHKELLEKNGFYTKLYNSQFKIKA